jgi:hypothetical protein
MLHSVVWWQLSDASKVITAPIISASSDSDSQFLPDYTDQQSETRCWYSSQWELQISLSLGICYISRLQIWPGVHCNEKTRYGI